MKGKKGRERGEIGVVSIIGREREGGRKSEGCKRNDEGRKRGQ